MQSRFPVQGVDKDMQPLENGIVAEVMQARLRTGGGDELVCVERLHGGHEIFP